MSGSQLFVAIFAILSIAISILAVWRVARAPGVQFKFLWIIGSLLGFVGFATDFGSAGDLYLSFGIQIPVLSLRVIGDGNIVVQVLFPVVAAIALATVAAAIPQIGRPLPPFASGIGTLRSSAWAFSRLANSPTHSACHLSSITNIGHA